MIRLPRRPRADRALQVLADPCDRPGHPGCRWCAHHRRLLAMTPAQHAVHLAEHRARMATQRAALAAGTLRLPPPVTRTVTL